MKRIVSFVLSIMVVFAMIVVGVQPISATSQIDSIISFARTLDETEEVAADVDGSGNVNVKDATAIQKWVAGIEKGFAIGEGI